MSRFGRDLLTRLVFPVVKPPEPTPLQPVLKPEPNERGAFPGFGITGGCGGDVVPVANHLGSAIRFAEQAAASADQQRDSAE